MTARLTERVWRWRASVEWRLTRHFFRATFDFGVLTEAGSDSFRHFLLGGIGGMIALGLLFTRILIGRYMILASYGTPEPYRRALIGDDMLIIGLPMLFAAFITLLVSQSLFPDERDFRILGPMPIKRSTIFATKLAGLLLFTGLFIGVAHAVLVPWMLLSSANRWLDHPILLRLIAWAIASVSASFFAVFAVAAIVGLLSVTLTGGRLHTTSAFMKSGVFAALVLCIPLVFQVAGVRSLVESGSAWLVLVPPAWFMGLQRTIVGRADAVMLQLAAGAVGALAAVAAITAGTYLLLFRHFERLVLRPATTWSNRATRSRPIATAWTAPAVRAIAGFTFTTLFRSQLHQSVVVGLSVFGLGIALNTVLGASPRTLAAARYWTPFAIMCGCGLAMRASLALPLNHRANWIFKMTEDPGTRRDQFRAVDYIVTAWVAGVPALWTLFIWWMATGSPSPIAASVVALIGLVAAHAVLSTWQRIPFTCSYLPGKRFVFYSITVGVLTGVAFSAIGSAIVGLAQSSVPRAVAIVALLSLCAWFLRRRRLATWGRTPLMFEDEFPDRPLELQL